MTESAHACAYCGTPLGPEAHLCSFCGRPTALANTEANAAAGTVVPGGTTVTPETTVPPGTVDNSYVNTFTPSPDADASVNADAFPNVPVRKKGSILLPVVIGGIALFLVCICLASAALLLFNYS